MQINGQKDGEQFKSVFHWDMKTQDGAGAASRQLQRNVVSAQKEGEGQGLWE